VIVFRIFIYLCVLPNILFCHYNKPESLMFPLRSRQRPGLKPQIHTTELSGMSSYLLSVNCIISGLSHEYKFTEAK
jgi:hypothetical protein